MSNKVSSGKEREFDRVLEKLVNKNLKPSKSSCQEVKIIQQKVRSVLLTKENPYKISRIVIAGSLGKATNIEPFDIDLIDFVNNANPPFEGVLKEWESQLDYSDLFEEIDIKLPYMITLKCGKYSVDILPARNFVQQNMSRENRLLVQHTKAIEMIRNETHPQNSFFSSSLAEYEVNFIEKQSAFVHKLIRLCKFWKDRIRLEDKTDRKISGLSFAIELIAVHVGRSEENSSKSLKKRPSITQAFENFLAELVNFEDIDVDFELPIEICRRTNGRVPQFQTPKIMDPGNPWNNLAYIFKKSDQKYLQNCASSSLGKMVDFIINTPSNCSDNYLLYRLLQVFDFPDKGVLYSFLESVTCGLIF